MDMRKFSASKLTQLIGFSLLSFSLTAAEQPDAKDLVGKMYLGGHGMYLKTDENRLLNSNANSVIDHASGLGIEGGYRVTELFEWRLSYTHLKPVAQMNNYDVPKGKSVALELLYFPYKESFYVVGGADALDVDDTKLSATLGAGYRHYLSKNMALYFEGRGHYQFDNRYTDMSTKLGFIYFFGSESTPVKRTEPVKAKPVQPAAYVAPVAVVAAVEKDSDNDSIVDSKDNCNNTPATDKVDEMGCTVFSEQQATVELRINFDNSKAIVKDEYKSELAKVADFMKVYPHVNLTINGHSSAQGSAKFNQSLSAKRAQAVVDVLIADFSIESTRLTAVGHGESKLLNTNNTPAAHEQNRRIEASITTVKKVAEKR